MLPPRKVWRTPVRQLRPPARPESRATRSRRRSRGTGSPIAPWVSHAPVRPLHHIAPPAYDWRTPPATATSPLVGKPSQDPISPICRYRAPTPSWVSQAPVAGDHQMFPRWYACFSPPGTTSRAPTGSPSSPPAPPSACQRVVIGSAASAEGAWLRFDVAVSAVLGVGGVVEAGVDAGVDAVGVVAAGGVVVADVGVKLVGEVLEEPVGADVGARVDGVTGGVVAVPALAVPVAVPVGVVGGPARDQPQRRPTSARPRPAPPPCCTREHGTPGGAASVGPSTTP